MTALYCKILSSVIKEVERQHYCSLTAKSNTQIKATRNIIKHEIGKLHLTQQIPSLLIDNEKLKDPEVIAHAFNTVFLEITENLNLCQEVRGDANYF
jgi:hypothetical protein